MKKNSLNKTALLLGAALVIAWPIASWSQAPVAGSPATAIATQAGIAPDSAPVPASLPAPTNQMLGSTHSVADGAPLTASASVDPAISSVLDRLKQDSAPLSLSDMSAAQDALARLNLLNEIEQKLAQIDETRAKRMGVMGLAGMGDGSFGSLPPQSVLNSAMGGRAYRPGQSSSTETEIVAIGGASGAFTATLSIGGRQIIAKTGTVLPDGSKVISIGVDGVSTLNHGKKSKLSFQMKTADSNNGGGAAPTNILGSTKP